MLQRSEVLDTLLSWLGELRQSVAENVDYTMDVWVPEVGAVATQSAFMCVLNHDKPLIPVIMSHSLIGRDILRLTGVNHVVLLLTWIPVSVPGALP